MSMPLIDTDQAYGDVIYPESDDKPMAENVLQGSVIRMLVCGFIAGCVRPRRLRAELARLRG